MYHSITIGEKNTYDDWHLVSSSRPVINPPKVKSNYIEIPGRDGVIDLTDSLIGRATYSNRTGSWDFIVLNEYAPGQDWTTLYTEIMEYLHGQNYKVILADDDPSFYYYGRLDVNQWRSNPTWSRIVIDYNLGPYKYDISYTEEGWLWDPFNFETGYVQSVKNQPITGNSSLDILVINRIENYIPIILTSNNGLSVTWNGETHTLDKGTNTISDIQLDIGENILHFSNSNSATVLVTVDIRGGRL